MRFPRSELARTALRPASALYGLATAARNSLYDRRWARVYRLPVPVVSIGNITVGGTGKTPLVIHLARSLLAAGVRPLVLSRGYRSKGAGTRVVSEGAEVLLGPEEGGDEPVLIARQVPGLPVVVDPDRVRGGRLAIRRFHPDLILLDDGFQHRRLGRDLDVVLLDAVDPFGRYALLPAGLLREPFAGLGRADLFIVTHAPRAEELETLVRVLRRYNDRAPILRARHDAEILIPLARAEPGGEARPLPPKEPSHGASRAEEVPAAARSPILRGERVYAFCGIGKPEGFLSTLQEAGAEIAGFVAFPDHHRYAAAEIDAVADAGRRAGARLVVTTEKDAVRISSAPKDPPFFALRIQMRLDPEGPLLERCLALARRREAPNNVETGTATGAGNGPPPGSGGAL